MNIYNDIKFITEPVLEKGQYYIYVAENYPQGNIKIGRTTNIQQRLYSLSGSNGGGNKLIKAAVSEPTYLYTLEKLIHDHYKQFRVKNTEWFVNITFDEVVKYITNIFNSKEYKVCNETRRLFQSKNN